MLHPKKLIGRVAFKLADLTGFYSVSRDYHKFVQMHGFFSFAVNLSGMFISTFLLKSGSTVTTVALYYLLAYFFEGTLGFLAARLSGKLSPTSLSRLGLIFYTFSYILLLVFRDTASLIYPFVAFFSALGASLYWLPYHLYTVGYTTMGNRQSSISYLGVISNVILLLTPPISGSIIYFLPGITGYIGVFIVSVIAFLAAALVTRTMPSEPTGRDYNVLLELIRKEYRNKIVINMSLAHLFYGIRDGLCLYYLNLLIFSTTDSELIMGLNTTGRGILVIVTFTLIAKGNLPWLRRWGALCAGLIALILTSVVTLWLVAGTVIVFSLVDAMLQAYNNNMLQFSAYSVSDYLHKRDGITNREGVLTLRSMTINLGRVLGMLLLLALPEGFGNPALILMLVSLISLPFAFFLNRVESVNQEAST